MNSKIYYIYDANLDGCEHLPFTPTQGGYYRITEDDVDVWVVADMFDRLYQPFMSGLGLLNHDDKTVHIKSVEKDPNYLVGAYNDTLLYSWVVASMSTRELTYENIIYMRDKSPKRLQFIVGILFNDLEDERFDVCLDDLHEFNSIQVLETIFNNYNGYMKSSENSDFVNKLLEETIEQFPNPNAISTYAHSMADLGRVKEARKIIKDMCSGGDIAACTSFVKSLVR